MDKSVISIESMAIIFSQSLVRKGFTKRGLRYFRPYQSSGVFFTDREILGLVLMGQLVIEIEDSKSILDEGDEFFLPSNNFFSATAGEHGAHFLFARKKN